MSDTVSCAAPQRLHGVDLKKAEALTRRLLLHADLLPQYVCSPPLPLTVPRALSQCVASGGLTPLAPPIDPGWRAADDGKGAATSAPPPPRAAKKRAQVLALVTAAAGLLSHARAPLVVDMCAGCGHVGLVFAALYPHATVILVDEKPVALRIAAARAKAAALHNVSTHVGAIEQFQLPRHTSDDEDDDEEGGGTVAAHDVTLFVALHACAGASDVVLARAAAANAAVVVVPCCVGGVVSHAGAVSGLGSASAICYDPAHGGHIDWTQPRSSAFRAAVSKSDYDSLARAADYSGDVGRDAWRGVAKALVEHDRSKWLRQVGYHARLIKLRPLDVTPKNDILVVWPPKLTMPDVTWCPDALANGVIVDFRDGSVLNGLGQEEVAVVQRVLEDSVTAPHSVGVYTSPPGTGARNRKIVHAVAEALGLSHESTGRGTDRLVVVKRTATWPLFFDYYVGIGGPAIEQVCQGLLAFGIVPKAYVERRKFLRGGPHHITLVSPKEVRKMPYKYKTDRNFCLRKFLDVLRGSSMRIVGIGRVRHDEPDQTEHSDGEQNELLQSSMPCSTAESYFAVVSWPAVQALRSTLGFQHNDLHITLGFKEKDVHLMPKNRSTVIFKTDMVCEPWSLT